MDESTWTVNHRYLSLWCLRTVQFLLSAVNHRYLIHCVRVTRLFWSCNFLMEWSQSFRTGNLIVLLFVLFIFRICETLVFQGLTKICVCFVLSWLYELFYNICLNRRSLSRSEIYPYFGFRPLFFQRDDSMDESI
jgi:hypothetical protein